MKSMQRRLLLSGLGAATLSGRAAVAQPTDYPNMPIRIVFPFAAGGKGDLVLRIVAEGASRELGQPIVVENRSGGSGTIGAQVVARARPDGYSLLFMSTTHSILPSLQQVPYNIDRDFAAVFGVYETPMVYVVRANSPIRSFEDIAALARSTPGGIDYSSGGAGTNGHLSMISLLRRMGVSGTHVTFRGSNLAAEALRGGHVQIICVTSADVLEMTKNGDLRWLAVASDRRDPEMPDVPTLTQAGFPNFDVTSWNLLVAPTGTPDAVVEKLHRVWGRQSQDEAVRARLLRIGVGVRPMSVAGVRDFLRDEVTRWRGVIEENNIRLEN